MIAGFADQTTEDVFHGLPSKAARKVPKAIWPIARRKLDMLNAAHEIRDLASPPGNRLEKLKGDYSGFFSIRVNEQYRIVFRFAEGRADEVKLTDYH